MLFLRFLLHFSCNFFTLFFLFFSGTYVECLSCDTPLGKIPGESIPYSDHEAVVAKLHVFKSLEGTTFVFLVCNNIIIYLLFKNYFINKIARSIINTNYRKLVIGWKYFTIFQNIKNRKKEVWISLEYMDIAFSNYLKGWSFTFFHLETLQSVPTLFYVVL